MDLAQELYKWFGFREFRPGQREVIEALLAGRDVLALLPTGAGKSLCYQLPALLRPGLTLVVSPLIALMKDQRDTFERIAPGQVAVIDSTLDRGTRISYIRKMIAGGFRLVFMAPERFRGWEMMGALDRCNIALLAIDEAHCINEWGHDFRPAYRHLGRFRQRMGMPATLALTATATPDVQQDVIAQLGLREPEVVSLSMDRPNLSFEVVATTTPADRQNKLRKLLKELPGTGIIYTGTREQAEQVAADVRQQGRTSDFYHAGLTAETRIAVQDAWMRGNPEVLAATNAFGMGIDKPDVRFVIHYALPSSLESYYQEAGRAGRDGQRSRCILIFNPKDQHRRARLLTLEIPSLEEVQRVYTEAGRERIGDFALISTEELAERTRFSDTKIDVAIKELERAKLLLRLPDGHRTAWVHPLGRPGERPQLRPDQELAPWQSTLIDSLPARGGDVPLGHWSQMLRIDPGSIEEFLWLLHYERYLDLRVSERALTLQFSNRSVGEKMRRLATSQIKELKDRQFRQLRPMVGYALSRLCRKQTLLIHFGQALAEPCGTCDVCRENPEAQNAARHVPVEALLQGPVKNLIDGIARFPNALGKLKWVKILAGSTAKELKFTPAAKSQAFGMFRSVQQRTIRDVIDGLLQIGFLGQTVEEFPTLDVPDRGQRLLRGELNPVEANLLARLDQLLRYHNQLQQPTPPADRGAARPGAADSATSGERPHLRTGSDGFDAILAVVSEHPNRVGRTGLAKILTGSKSKQLAASGLAAPPHYGAMSGMSQDAVIGLIDEALADGLLELTQSKYPVLHLTDAGTQRVGKTIPEPEPQALPTQKPSATPEQAPAPKKDTVLPLRSLSGVIIGQARPEVGSSAIKQPPVPTPLPAASSARSDSPALPSRPASPANIANPGNPANSVGTASSAKPGRKIGAHPAPQDAPTTGLLFPAPPPQVEDPPRRPGRLDYSLAAGVIREAVKLLSPNIDEDVAAHLLWLIGESGDRKQVYVIGQYLTHSQRKVREAAAAALARLRESAGGDR